MKILCPHCQQRILLQNVKPGRYAPACRHCGETFALLVPSNADSSPVLAPTTKQLDRRLDAAQATVAPSLGPSQASEAATLVEPASPHTDQPAAAASEAATLAEPLVAPPPVPGETPPAASGRLDGYELQGLIGRGGMGEVYLARQVSLDRPVAVKTLHPKWSRDPLFISRFTREAYAAAQLVHHNVVQIYDVGEDGGTNYFSMEYVRGCPLSDRIRQDGALDPEEAAGYILQAARGLKFAHDHGMIHRDVKPDNLLLNEEGIVKVADLGLVKTPSDPRADTGTSQSHTTDSTDANVTAASATMGTPAYMAPEQARDAAAVDHRADIYSLGCTFYALLTGRAVFEGETAAEVITKHATNKVVPPEIVADKVPRPLSAIVQKMLAKNPDDRYGDTDQVIAALEDFLGVTAGPFTPRPEHSAALQDAVKAFNQAPAARLRRGLLLAFHAGCALGIAGAALASSPLVAGALVGLWVLTTAGYLVVRGLFDKTYLLRRVRQFIFSSRLSDWLTWLVALAAALVALWLFELLGSWAILCGAAAGLAFVFYLVIDRRVKRERRPHVQAVAEMLRGMRQRGLEEDALRRFVCRYSGRSWEPFYENLFDYPQKLRARELWGRGDDGKPRPRSGAWRDHVLHLLDQRQQAREDGRKRRHLQRVEEKRLKAEGRSMDEARRNAESAARQMMAEAAQLKKALVEAVASSAPAPSAAKPTSTAPAGTTGKAAPKPPTVAQMVRPPVKMTVEPVEPKWLVVARRVLGGQARFVVGAALLAMALVWMKQRGLLPGADGTRAVSDLANAEPPLNIPGVPEAVMQILCRYGTGLAGLALVISAPFGGIRTTLWMLPGVALLIVGHLLPLPDLGILGPGQLPVAAGLVASAAGLYFGRDPSQRIRSTPWS